MPARKNRLGKYPPQPVLELVRARNPTASPEVRAFRAALVQNIIRSERLDPYGLHYIPGLADEISRMVAAKQLRAALVNGCPDYSYVWVTGKFRVDYMGADPDKL
jgi:hypothetical protein